jgi:two-component system LytT family response regulator
MKPQIAQKCIIIDDELHCQNALKRALKAYCPQVEVLATFNDITSARQGIVHHLPDLIFLDVEMPGGNGFELVDQLGDVINIPIIFTTAHEAYALQALKHKAADYLLKPIDGQELQATLRKIGSDKKANEASQQLRVSLPSLNGFVLVLKEDVIRCEAAGSYTKVITPAKEHLVSRSIGYLEERLSDRNFFRVHKSHLVNIDHIQEYVKGKGGMLILSDGSHVDVSKRKKEDFLLALQYR